MIIYFHAFTVYEWYSDCCVFLCVVVWTYWLFLICFLHTKQSDGIESQMYKLHQVLYHSAWIINRSVMMHHRLCMVMSTGPYRSNKAIMFVFCGFFLRTWHFKSNGAWRGNLLSICSYLLMVALPNDLHDWLLATIHGVSTLGRRRKHPSD